jgi:hypothetical protein
MADYVRGIHLVTHGGRQVFIERSSGADVADPFGGVGPVLSPSFVRRLGAELVRDDDLLRAASVGFGSFGLIFALLLEVDELFYLRRRRSRRDVDASLRRAIDARDPQALSMPSGPGELYHFEVTVNPYSLNAGQGGAYVTTIHRTGAPTTPQAAPASAFGDAVGRALGGLIGAAPALVPALLSTLLESELGEVDEVGTLGELFTQGAGGPRYRPISTEIALHRRHASRALDLILNVVKLGQPDYFYPGLIALRYVAQSRTLLGFNRFTENVTIELPALGHLRGTLDFYGRVWAALSAANIPYTLHWGQVNQLGRETVRAMWGDAAVDRWLRARRGLLSPAGRKMFANPYLVRCGLSR